MMALWWRLLLEAKFADNDWQDMVIKRGQLVTSIAKLSVESGLSAKQVRLCLERLKKTGEICLETTNKYTIITICNYDDYQSLDQQQGQTNGNQMENRGQTDGKQRANKGQQDNKSNKGNESKEGKEIPPIIPPQNGRVCYDAYGKDDFKNVFLKPAELRQLQMNFGEEETQEAIEDLSLKLEDGTQQPSLNHYATLTYWLTQRRKKKLREKESQPKGRDLIGNDDEFITDNTYQQ
jgi:hypothetical protein